MAFSKNEIVGRKVRGGADQIGDLYECSWTSNSTGSYAETLTAMLGFIVAAYFIPAGDTTTGRPSNGYDVVLNNSYGIDVLRGFGANQSDTATGVYPTTTSMAIGPVNGDCVLQVSNAGDTRRGTVVLEMFYP